MSVDPADVPFAAGEEVDVIHGGSDTEVFRGVIEAVSPSGLVMVGDERSDYHGPDDPLGAYYRAFVPWSGMRVESIDATDPPA